MNLTIEIESPRGLRCRISKFRLLLGVETRLTGSCCPHFICVIQGKALIYHAFTPESRKPKDCSFCSQSSIHTVSALEHF